MAHKHNRLLLSTVGGGQDVLTRTVTKRYAQLVNYLFLGHNFVTFLFLDLPN